MRKRVRVLVALIFVLSLFFYGYYLGDFTRSFNQENQAKNEIDNTIDQPEPIKTEVEFFSKPEVSKISKELCEENCGYCYPEEDYPSLKWRQNLPKLFRDVEETCQFKYLNAIVPGGLRKRKVPLKIMAIWSVNDELQMAYDKMEVLKEVVDYFVFGEGDFSYQGARKPLHIRENWDFFKKFHSQMKVFSIDYYEPRTGTDESSNWVNENFSWLEIRRKAIEWGMQEANFDDSDIINANNIDMTTEPIVYYVLKYYEGFPDEWFEFRMTWFEFHFGWLLGNYYQCNTASLGRFKEGVYEGKWGKKGNSRNIYPAKHHEECNFGVHCRDCFEPWNVTSKYMTYSHLNPKDRIFLKLLERGVPKEEFLEKFTELVKVAMKRGIAFHHDILMNKQFDASFLFENIFPRKYLQDPERYSRYFSPDFKEEHGENWVKVVGSNPLQKQEGDFWRSPSEIAGIDTVRVDQSYWDELVDEVLLLG